MNHTGKCPSQVPALGASRGSPRGPGRVRSPACRLALLRPSVCASSRPWRQQRPYLEEEAVKLFSMQRTMKALWQLAALCSSSRPASSEEAWPVAALASVRHVSQ